MIEQQDILTTAGEKPEGITNISDLQTAIHRLEVRRREQEDSLQEKYRQLIAGLEPKNIIKNTFYQIRESVSVKQDLIKIILGLGVSYLSGNIAAKGSPTGLIRKTLGPALLLGITSLISGKRQDDDDATPSRLNNFLRKLFKKRQ